MAQRQPKAALPVPPAPRSAFATLLRELGGAALALVALVAGVLFTAVFFEVALEQGAGPWWQIGIAFGLALLVTVLSMGLVFAMVGPHVGATAQAWTALLAGRAPAAAGAPGPLALANLATFVLAALGGVALYRAGVRAVEVGWAVQGALLVLAGVLFGLLPAIPRLAAVRRSPAAAPTAPATLSAAAPRAAGRGAALFVTLAALGLGLSMALAEVTPALRFAGEPRPIPYGDWADGCVDDQLAGCTPQASVHFTVPRAGVARVETVQFGCTTRILRRAAPAPATTGRTGEATVYHDVSVAAGDTLHVFVAAAAAPAACTYSVRWRWAP